MVMKRTLETQHSREFTDDIFIVLIKAVNIYKEIFFFALSSEQSEV